MSIQHKDNGVYVIHGAYDGTFDLAGKSIADAQGDLVETFQFQSLPIPLVSGNDVETTFTIDTIDRRAFVNRNGTGLHDLLTPEQLIDRWRISLEEYRELREMGIPTISFRSGTVRHPVLAIDEWLKQVNIVSTYKLQPENCNTGREWINPPTADPPLSHRFGPLVGTQEQLASWLHPHGKSDPRHLKGKAGRSIVWVRAVHSRLNEVWFRSQRELDTAKIASQNLI